MQTPVRIRSLACTEDKLTRGMDCARVCQLATGCWIVEPMNCVVTGGQDLPRGHWAVGSYARLLGRLAHVGAQGLAVLRARGSGLGILWGRY